MLIGNYHLGQSVSFSKAGLGKVEVGFSILRKRLEFATFYPEGDVCHFHVPIERLGRVIISTNVAEATAAAGPNCVYHGEEPKSCLQPPRRKFRSG